MAVDLPGDRPLPPAEGGGAGRDEMNIAEFPITLLSDRAPRNCNRVEYADRIFDPHSGKEITRRLIVTAPAEYGLPTATDDDVILALIQLTRRQNNFTRPEVSFTRLQLIDLIGCPDNGYSFDRIVASLDRWTSTYLKYENAWWDNQGRRWISGGFHIVNSYKIADGRAAGPASRCQLVWGEEFFQSCQAGYLKGLDYDLYVRLGSHLARRMYRFLDKRFYHKPDWEFELKDFAFEHVGLSRSYRDAGKIKEKLQRGIEELERVGFLEPLPRDQRYAKNGRQWLIRMKRKLVEPVSVPEPSPEDAPTVEELVARGVTLATAVELARQHPAEAIARQVEVHDWLVERNDRRVRLSPAGYLVDSIRKGYAPPKGYLSRAAREAKEREAMALFEAAEQGRRRDREREDREREDREAIDRHWRSLGPDERARLDEDALAAADAEVVAAYRAMRPASLRAAFFRGSIRDPYIGRLLAGAPATAVEEPAGATTS